MGKKWDRTSDFYKWSKQRAEGLFRVLKPGGYAAIFGHPKTNHRMKCAFEDVGFRIVDEIDWIYLSGMPKNQDIGKLFDKAAGVEREVIGRDCKAYRPNAVKTHKDGQVGGFGLKGEGSGIITAPMTEMAKKWDGWKTAGLKPAHEPITIFQKPLDGTYINNIEKYNCGAMNIEACRIPFKNDADVNMVKAKCNFTEHSKSIGFGGQDTIYGTGHTPLEQARDCVKEGGRFPANLIFDEYTAALLDEQTGVTKSTGGSGEASRIGRARRIYGAYQDQTNKDYINHSLGGYGDVGGGSRMFNIIKYCPKVAQSERRLADGIRNPHVTLKPVELIKWLIKLITPPDGTTIDITACI